MANINGNKAQHSYSLYITGFPEHFDEWNLFHMFRAWGQIDNIIVPKQRGKENLSKWSQHAYVDMVSEEDIQMVLKNVDINSQIIIPNSDILLTVKRCMLKQDSYSPKLETQNGIRKTAVLVYSKNELLAIRDLCNDGPLTSISNDCNHLLKCV